MSKTNLETGDAVAPSRFWTRLACLWLVASSLGPDVPLGGGPLRARPEDLLTIAMAVPIGVRWFCGRTRRATLSVFRCLLQLTVGFALTAAVGMLVRVMVGAPLPTEGSFGFDQQQEALKEVFRFSKLILVALAFGQAGRIAWRPVIKTLATCCVVMVGIQVWQYVASDSINPWLTAVYGGADNVLGYSTTAAAQGGTFRAGSVMLNPNVFGAYLVAPLMIFGLSLLASFNSRDRSARRDRRYNLVASGTLWTGMFLTQSRTMLLAAIAGGIVALASLGHRNRRRVMKLGLSFAVVAVVTFVLFGTATNRFSIDGLVRGFTKESFNIKLALTLETMRDLGPLMIFGSGPAGAQQVDNELGYVVTWYGFVGLAMYLWFYVSVYRLVSRGIGDVYSRAAFKGILTAYVIGAAGSSFLLNNRVFPVFIALTTISLSDRVRRRAIMPSPRTVSPPSVTHFPATPSQAPTPSAVLSGLLGASPPMCHSPYA